MKGDLIINGTIDAWESYGVNMGEGFVDAICTPPSLKEFVTNESRLEHGRRVVVDNPKMTNREITLPFTIYGKDTGAFISHKDSFIAMLQMGNVSIKIPALGNDVYHLIYTGKGIAFSMNTKRTFCKFSAKFEEPDPSKRS